MSNHTYSIDNCLPPGTAPASCCITGYTTDPAALLSTAYQYNALGRMVRSQVQESAPMLFTYDEFGNETQRVLALAAEPAPSNSPVVSTLYAVTQEADGSVYRHRTTMSYSAAGDVVRETGAELLSEHALLESRSVRTDRRGNVSTEWTEYGNGTRRIAKSTIPGSELTAQAVSVDGFTISQVDHAGVTSSAARRFTESGIEYTQTDGRGNTSTTRTDIAGRTVGTTDAAGNTTTTAYCPCCDNPAIITDALGNTTCYRYDERGRKVAEWGTAIQPALFGYDDADRMTTLTTFRAGAETISTDPAGRTDGDTTTWTYDDPTGLETAKTYADGNGTAKTYDAYNRLATETDARGRVKTYSYEQARGLLLEISYSDDTPTESFAYNHLAQLVVVADSAGTRAIGYNEYAEQSTDSLLAGGKTHLVTETRDSLGRSTGYTYAKDSSVQQTVTTSYGTDGRISSAGFLHGGQEKQFAYAYLQGTHLLQTLTKPNGMTLTQTYEQHRDLLTQMDYNRGDTLVAQRTYAYDQLSRPTTRTITRQGSTRTDAYTYNNRSELIGDVVDGTGLNGWDYDNIGNRRMEHRSDGYEIYTANQLNQYTAIEEAEGTFTPTYDADGNQTRVKTSTGIWNVTYNAKNRPVLFTKDDNSVSVECTYDYMGRRATKKVTENGTVTLHQRYLYRGYLQIACCDLLRPAHPCIWLITWDPTQEIATRPLAIQKDGTWYTYGWDLTKNIWETYTTTGYIGTAYTYTAYGQVTASGAVEQPIQWSSEYNDTELGLVYYNYRHYTPADGRWIGRDFLQQLRLYAYSLNRPIYTCDHIGLNECKESFTGKCGPNVTAWLIATIKNNMSKMKNIIKEIDKQYLNNIISLSYVLPSPESAGFLVGMRVNREEQILSNFREKVTHNGAWDIKRLNYETSSCPTKKCENTVSVCGMCFAKDMIGNLHYGAVGMLVASSSLLKKMGHYAASSGGKINMALAILGWITPDSPDDQKSIDIGTKLYETGDVSENSLCNLLSKSNHQELVDSSQWQTVSTCKPCSEKYDN